LRSSEPASANAGRERCGGGSRLIGRMIAGQRQLDWHLRQNLTGGAGRRSSLRPDLAVRWSPAVRPAMPDAHARHDVDPRVAVAIARALLRSSVPARRVASPRRPAVAAAAADRHAARRCLEKTACLNRSLAPTRRCCIRPLVRKRASPEARAPRRRSRSRISCFIAAARK
jgi:hypothetical protein